MDKIKLLAKVDEALIKEELAIPIYASHIEGSLFWSGLAEDRQTEIINLLQVLSRESQGHVKLLEKLKELYTK